MLVSLSDKELDDPLELDDPSESDDRADSGCNLE